MGNSSECKQILPYLFKDKRRNIFHDDLFKEKDAERKQKEEDLNAEDIVSEMIAFGTEISRSKDKKEV